MRQFVIFILFSLCLASANSFSKRITKVSYSKSKPSSDRYGYVKTLEAQKMNEYIREDLREIIKKKDYEKRKEEGRLTEEELAVENAPPPEKEEKKEEEKDKATVAKETNLIQLKKDEEERKIKLLDDDSQAEIDLKAENAKIVKELVHGLDFTSFDPSAVHQNSIINQGLGFFKSKGLTPAELYIIERSANKYYDAKITSEEWMEFYRTFIEPYEKYCSPDFHYKVSLKNFHNCLNQPELQFLRSAHSDSIYLLRSSVTNYLRIDRFGEIKFSDYVLLRRAQTAVKKCGSKNGVGKTQFSCALQITIPRMQLFTNSESSKLFDLARNMRSNLQANDLYVDILSLTLVSRYLTWFLHLTSGLPTLGMTQSKFKEAAESKDFPFEILAEEVPRLFLSLGVEEIGQSEFIAIMYSLSLIKQNRISSDFAMCSQSWESLIADSNFNSEIVNDIDKSEVLNANQIMDGPIDDNLTGKEKKDDDFITAFVQLSSNTGSKISRIDHSLSKEEISRRRLSVYKLLDISGKEELTPSNLLVFLKSSWLFLGIDQFHSGIVGKQDLAKFGTELKSPIFLNSADKASIETAILITSTNVKLNIREFLIIFNAEEIFIKAKKDGGGSLKFPGFSRIMERIQIPSFNTMKINDKSDQQAKEITKSDYFEKIKIAVQNEAEINTNKLMSQNSRFHRRILSKGSPRHKISK